MDAEIFYFKGQEGCLPALKTLLRTHVYSAINLAVHEIEMPSYQRGATQLAWRYVKLLQASVPPEKGLHLSITELETFGYRFYIEIYYALSSSAYTGRRDGWKAFRGDEVGSFFPAVAIRERMALVPRGLGERLAYQSLSPFAPFEMGGILEVDFDAEAELNSGVTQVGHKLRADFLRELRAYASYQELRDMNLPKLAQDLDVELGFIQHSLKAEAVEAAFYRQLACEFDQEKLPLNRWTKVMLTVRNDSDVALPDLAVEVAGPAKIRPAHIQATFAPHSAQEIPIAIMPEDVGDFPLEVTFVLPDDKLFADWLPVHHVWLQCE